jgi:hypothetical protein
MAVPLGKTDNVAGATSGRNLQGRGKSGAIHRCGSSRGAHIASSPRLASHKICLRRHRWMIENRP